MAKTDPETSALKEQLADALSQMDSLQAAVADAEARAETGRERLAGLHGEPEAGEGVVGEMREKREGERGGETPPVPAGAPVRRAPDFSGLPPAEKIKVGLQGVSRREGEEGDHQPIPPRLP